MGLVRKPTMVTCAVVWSIAATTGAYARVCGDADRSFDVTLSDGVHVLRRAAGLSSLCGDNPPICDVDGDGVTTITDGVSVLRKVAGLDAPDACPSGATPDVQAVTDVVVPLLVWALPQVRDVRISSASVRAANTRGCTLGGTRTTRREGDGGIVTLDGWQTPDIAAGCVTIDGSIQVQISANIPMTVALRLSLADSRVVDFGGTIRSTSEGFGWVFDGGPLVARRPHEAEDFFRLTFQHFAIDPDGLLDGGSVEIEDTTGRLEFSTVVLSLTDNLDAFARVVRDDGTVGHYHLDLVTGDLFPAF